MNSQNSSSVLLLGGYGSLGSRIARLLRQHHPELHLTIAGRNREKAGALATELGNADTALVNLSRADLGLPQEHAFSVVVTAVNMERIAQVGPLPPQVRGGRWTHATGDEAARTFTGVGGVPHQGDAVGLVDLLSLSSIETVNLLRLDVAVGSTASSRRGKGPSHEVIIEISGELAGGENARYRYELVDPEGYATMSARGVAVCIERLLGLNGGAAPGPGLYLPESLVDPTYLLEQVQAGGVTVNRYEV